MAHTWRQLFITVALQFNQIIFWFNYLRRAFYVSSLFALVINFIAGMQRLLFQHPVYRQAFILILFSCPTLRNGEEEIHFNA